MQFIIFLISKSCKFKNYYIVDEEKRKYDNMLPQFYENPLTETGNFCDVNKMLTYLSSRVSRAKFFTHAVHTHSVFITLGP